MGENARILIVDDDESIRKVLSAILADEGYEVDTAGNGKEAIDKSNEKLYNLALIDIRLPDMEGVEILAKIKVTVPKMRKIIITGFPSLQNAVAALNKGADAYIMKPFDVENILTAIKEQLSKQQEEKKFTQDKVTEFIQTRCKELEEEQTVTNKG
jgi:DNA-binding NtrC family response regulator